MARKHNFWWTTRPKRKLITIVDVLRVFLAVAEGKEWSRNKKLHVMFEVALEQNGLKRIGTRRDGQGGGGRTFAHWLFSFGLYFTDSSGIVRPTFAGEDLVKGEPPVPIITHQILHFQYPSPFSRRTLVDRRFRIFPFRFILNLLLHPKLNGKLTEEELAHFVITKAEQSRDLNEIASIIANYRSHGIKPALDRNSTNAELTEIKDVANVFVNQLEYSQLIEIDEEARSFSIPSDKFEYVRDLLGQCRPLINVDEGDDEVFQRKYGRGPKHHRDNRTFDDYSTVTTDQSERRTVLLVLSDFLARQPISSLSKSLFHRISEKSGVDVKRVENIVHQLGIKPVISVFEEKYLQLSTGGVATALDFEKATEGIFGVEGFGFEVKWIGSQGSNPDVLVMNLHEDNRFCGIVDTKASPAYSINGNHRRVMAHEYIPKYANHRHQNLECPLGFFAYIAGGFKGRVDKGLQNIFAASGVSGSAITAKSLLSLLSKHKAGEISKDELKRLFAINRQILSTDIEKNY